MTPFAMEGCAMRHDPASAAVVVMLKALKMDASKNRLISA
jgi:hypothetical protein